MSNTRDASFPTIIGLGHVLAIVLVTQADGQSVAPSADAHNTTGANWSKRGREDLAIAEFSEAIRIAPNFYLAYYNRGVSWERQRRADLATADYDAAIRLNPGFAPAYLNRGILRDGQRQYDLAVADYNETIRLQPGEARAFMNRANIWDDKGRYDLAVADYNEAIRLNPGFVLAYHNRGICWKRQGRHDRAVADFGEVIRLDPSFIKAYADRALLLAAGNENIRDGKRAFQDASVAYRLGPKTDGFFAEVLAAAYAECGDFKQAVDYQEKAAALFTDSARRRFAYERRDWYRQQRPYRLTAAEPARRR